MSYPNNLPPTYIKMRKIIMILHLTLCICVVGAALFWFFTDNNGIEFIGKYIGIAIHRKSIFG